MLVCLVTLYIKTNTWIVYFNLELFAVHLEALFCIDFRGGFSSPFFKNKVTTFCLAISLVWYILTQLCTTVSMKSDEYIK